MTLQVLSGLKSPSKVFIDFLIKENVLKEEFRSIIGSRDFPELDQYLLTKKIVDPIKLAELYAAFYEVPFVRLIDRPIKPSVLHLLPVEVAKRYTVIPIELEGLNLTLGVGDPSRLQRNAPGMIASLKQEKGIRIQLNIVPKADVEALIRKLSLADQPPISSQETVKSIEPKDIKSISDPPIPAPITEEKKDEDKKSDGFGKTLLKAVEHREKEVDLRQIKIPDAILRKIPLEVAKRYGLIAFDQQDSKSKFELPMIKMALVNPHDAKAREIISYIEAKNKVLVERYRTSAESLEFGYSLYQKEEPKTDDAKNTPKEKDGKDKDAEEIIESEIIEAPGGNIKVDKEELKAIPLPKPVEKGEEIPGEKTDKVIIPDSKKVTVSDAEKSNIKSGLTRVPGVNEGVSLSSDDIINRPSVGNSTEELQRLAKEQENSLESQNLDRLLHAPVLSIEDLAKVFKNGVIPEIVAATLFIAIRMKASDVHIEALENAVRVRFRIDGILHDILSVPHFLHAPLTSRIKILAKMKIDEQRIPQDGRFDVIIDKRQVDLRVSTLPTVHGEKIVMRLLDKSGGVLTLEQLGVTGSNFDRLINNVNKPYGIILATGPTGSGKSTTLYAVLSRLSKPGVNIITLEDPVEYELAGVNQSQVKPQIGFTFAEGLRSVLRQDPNIIMVGEVRDLETAAMATHAALTGHLVLTTLHTNDAAGALPRLINMGVEPFLITSSVNAVVGQRLVRKICDHCREKVDIPRAMLEIIKGELSTLPSGQMKNINLEQLVFYHGKGCSECNNGYSGRIGIYEVLSMSSQIEELAVKKAPASDIKKAAIANGMITMTQDGLVKALKGITTVDEIMRVTTTHTKELPGIDA